MDLIRHDCAPERSLIIVTILYTTALTVSTSVQNALSQKSTCDPFIPFGECPIGEYEGQRRVQSTTTYLQYSISFIVALLAGAWSDSHGRRRKPLIFLPIIGQILTDGLNFVNHFWYWSSSFNIIFTSVIPGLYVGRNMFWVGVMSYVSENSNFECRTLKHGLITVTYTFSLLIGWGLVAILKNGTDYVNRYLLFVVPILFNLFAILIGYLYIEDNSGTCNKDYIIWLRPNFVFKGIIDLFKYKCKGFSIVLAILIICQSVIVARIGSEYEIIMQYISTSFIWYNDDYIYFSVIKMFAIIFGTMFSVFVLSYSLKINDLAIGVLACIVYIIAAVIYVISNQFWQIFMIAMIYLCHGSAVTITISLASKLVENDHLGRFYSIQTCMNSILTFGVIMAYKTACDNIMFSIKLSHFNLVMLMYVILTIPILFVYITVYSKCKDFWQRDATRTLRTRQQFIHAIST